MSEVDWRKNFTPEQVAIMERYKEAHESALWSMPISSYREIENALLSGKDLGTAIRDDIDEVSKRTDIEYQKLLERDIALPKDPLPFDD